MDEKQLILEYLDSGDIAGLQEYLTTNPEAVQRLKVLERQRDPVIKDIEKKLGMGLKTFIGGLGTAEGIRQTRYGDRQLSRLQKPSAPTFSGYDPALANFMSKVNQYYTSPEKTGVVEPMMGGIREAYGTGLEQAKTASGGQAGAFGSQAQSLYNQRLKQTSQIPAILSGVQAQQGELYANLLQQRQGERRRADVFDLTKYQMGLGQYNLESEAYGGLASQGRENTALGVQQIGQGLIPFMSPAFKKQGSYGGGVNPSQVTAPRGALDVDPYSPYSAANLYEPTGFDELDGLGYDVTNSMNNRLIG